MNDRAVLHSSNTNEWYTPAGYVELARRVMGDIDLDPASCEFANRTVKATRFFDINEDGLTLSWPGRVWLNPPYGRGSLKKWTTKLLAEVALGHTTEAILLVNAVTGEKWFKPLWDYTLCFPYRRIKFYNRHGLPNSPTHSHVFVYFGEHIHRFCSEFNSIGAIVMRFMRSTL